MSAGRDTVQRILRRPLLLVLLGLVLLALRMPPSSGDAVDDGGGYFRMPAVRLVLPRGLVPNGSALMTARASPSAGATYTLQPTSPMPWLRVHPTSGQVILDAAAAEVAGFLDAAGGGLQLTVRASWGGGATSVDMNLTLGLMANDTTCEDFSPEALCFWDSFTFSIKENEHSDSLGELRPAYLRHTCPHYAVSYAIEQGPPDIFEITQTPDDNWQLSTKMQLDREITNEWNLTLKCHLTSMKGSAKVVQRNLTVNIIDEDDCPPNAKITNHEDYIINPEVKKGQNLNTGLLVVLDADSSGVNNYEIDIKEKNYQGKLFNISLKKYEVNLPRQGPIVYEDSYAVINSSEERKISMHPSSTAIYIEVAFAKKTKLTNQSYSTSFTLTDVSLKGGNLGANQVNICLTLTVGSNPRIANTTASTESRVDTKGNKSDITTAYPSIVNVSAAATNYARIAQPQVAVANLGATLLPAESPFAVTPAEGIVYVRSASRLHPGDSHIVHIWWEAGGGGEGLAATINITVADVGGGTCGRRGRGGTYISCASKQFAASCVATCGLGSPGACTWRKSPRDATRRLSPTYATCRPEASSCPNGACDELEEMSIGICPQDCTREVYGSARKQEGRGIKSATGVCSCDNFGKCSCGPVGTKAATAPQHRQSTSEPPRGVDAGDTRGTVDQKASFDRYQGSCGANCLFALLLGVITAITIVLVGGCLARRRAVKRGGESGADAARRLGMGSSRGPEAAPAAAVAALAGRGLEMDDAEASQSAQELPLLSVRANSGPEGGDPRWELPRDALRLEGALGEGEFGLVHKAKMRSTSHTGPDSLTPYQTVAVKTLKEGAGDMERAALESEFKLLQSVNHINIVRLIGACTVPRNQSFLLVIEYAELGSLRNYLRKSRLNGAPLRRLPIAKPNAEEINSVWMAHDDASSTDSLTPRHIISFAWQISKGMAYLSEMKLVHRDLAARNVLLSEKGICKISDFGLTRDVYEDEAYYKKSKGRVPVKWMAPESLSDHLYTTQSDVWSFGVLLWELITLGLSPYPGVPLSGLFSLLHSGYRMQKPPNCSSELYQIMMCCWELHPRERPTFPYLMESLERMLQDEVEYLHLGPLLAVNPIYFSEVPADNSREPPLGGQTAAPSSDCPLWGVERGGGEDEHPVEGGPAAGEAGGRQPVAAGRGDCDWRELGDSEEEASDEKMSLQCYSQCYFMMENTQNELDDGYEVPKLFQTRRSDSQVVVQLTSAQEDL